MTVIAPRSPVNERVSSRSKTFLTPWKPKYLLMVDQIPESGHFIKYKSVHTARALIGLAD
jgi:hypothetical protein